MKTRPSEFRPSIRVVKRGWSSVLLPHIVVTWKGAEVFIVVCDNDDEAAEYLATIKIQGETTFCPSAGNPWLVVGHGWSGKSMTSVRPGEQQRNLTQAVLDKYGWDDAEPIAIAL